LLTAIACGYIQAVDEQAFFGRLYPLRFSMHYVYLSIAIIAETIATSTLKATDGFKRPLPTVVVAIGYGLAFFLLSVVVRTLPVGIVYAIWSGAGIVLVAIVGIVWLKQSLDAPAIFGMGLILIGVIIVNVFSKAVPH
jgi:small multidrug resistance pump